MLAPVELMGPQEIGDLLGVSRQRVYQLTGRVDFPAPLAELAQGRVWDGTTVRAWAQKHGRLLADDE
jgi:predicted DNA-binding transcriptional regulator AlpA